MLRQALCVNKILLLQQSRNLAFFAYAIGSEEGASIHSQEELLKSLETLSSL